MTMRWPWLYPGDEYYAPSLWLPTWRGWFVVFVDFTGTPWWRRCVRTLWL